MRSFAQLVFAGLALGSVYALVALGFTVVYRASRVVNFAQGGLLALGAFLTSWLVISEGLSFWVAFPVGVVATAATGAIFCAWVLRLAAGRPDFVVVMVTLGLDGVLGAAVPTLWGTAPRANGDPWGASALHGAALVFDWDQVWAVATAVAMMACLWAFNRTRAGVAVRAAAADPEAALAAGIPLRRVVTMAWALAGGLACAAGVFAAGYPASLDPTVADVALVAFPAVILGGIDSTTGAVAGGVVIGLVQELAAGYQPRYLAWLGHDFYLAAPYVVMIAVVLVRPQGMWGSRPAGRL
ncbi:MAG: branched-chain amino acid ABC transporter permease [Acidimicrobiales bacterium]